jgi:hypothetical protein
MQFSVGYLWDQHELIVSFQNQASVSDTILLQLAVGSLLNKESGKKFKETIKRMLKE